MLNRNVSLAVCLCILASVAALGQGNQGTGYLFQVPGANSSGARFQGFIYNANPFNAVIDANGPTATRQIIAKPDGTKFYVLGASAGGLESVDPAFGTFRAINGIGGTTCTAAITNDGKYLLVAAAASCGGAAPSTLYILDTSNETVLQHTINITGTIIGFAVSADSKTAWALANSAFGSSVSAFSLSTRARTALLNLPFGGSTSISISPQGLLYVTAVNRVYEITTTAPDAFSCDNSFTEGPPLCVTTNGQIAIVATPGPLRFTPSGQTAYLVNTDPTTGGQSLLKVNLQTHVVVSWPAFNSGITPPIFSDVLVASENRVFAISSSDTTLWDVTPSPLSAAPSSTLAGVFPTTSVLAGALSNELPSARFLYILSGNGNQTNLLRIDLATNTISVQTLALLGNGALQFVVVPPETGAAGFQQFNTNQTVKAGATSAPLTALVLDATGRPVFNLPVTYSVDSTTGVVINGAAQTTNVNGYVSTTATVPATPGTYTVTLTAGTAVANYSLTVAGTTTGGGPGPSNQVTIVGGNGMFLQAFSPSPSYSPLTVRVTNADGSKPLVNEPVTFSIVSGPGSIDNASTVTDANGLASTDFFAQQPNQGVSFQSTDVNASTAEGSVDFIETTYILNMDGTGQPQVSMITPGPDTGYVAKVGEGDVVPNGIVAAIYSSVIPDIGKGIPNVGIRIADANDISLPGPASCQGSSLSDQLGIAHCTVVTSCQVNLGPVGVNVVVGENRIFRAILNVVPGSSQALSILNGNNQSGQAGSTLPQALVAMVTDNCGRAIPGAAVTWKVTSGSATLQTNGANFNISDSGGRVSAKVVLGQTPGAVTVTVSTGTGSVSTFTLTNNVVVTGITLTSGGGQTALLNQAFAQPVVFQVKDVNGNPVPNILVTFSVASGNAGVSPASVNTDAQGRASTTVTAGSSASNVTITATYNTFSASAQLTVKAPGPAVTASSFTNAATSGSISPQVGLVPCGLGTVTGAGLATTVPGVVLGNPLGIGPLPYSLSGLSMSVNGVPVPLLSISNQNGVQQVNFQTPCETQPGSATVVIQVNGTNATVSGVPVLAVQPGIINYAGPNNKAYGFVISASDGSYVTPSNPAHRGQTYYVVLTGLGQTTPPIITNAAGTGNQTIPLSQVVVGVNNSGVPVTLAQYASGQVGVYVIGFTIPANAPTGPDQNLAVQVGGVFGNAVYLPAVN